MNEVKCVVVTSDDWSSEEHSIIPFRVLVPETNGKPEDNVLNVLSYLRRNNYEKIPNIDSIVTRFKGELGTRFWDSIDWDNAEIIDPSPQTSGEAWNLYRCLNDGGRVKELESLIAQDDDLAGRYGAIQPKSDWKYWEDEELEHSPAWLFMYAQQVMKGKLPEHLHAAMVMHSYRVGDNFWVKKYFKSRRYKFHCKKNLRITERFMVS